MVLYINIYHLATQCPKLLLKSPEGAACWLLMDSLEQGVCCWNEWEGRTKAGSPPSAGQNHTQNIKIVDQDLKKPGRSTKWLEGLKVKNVTLTTGGAISVLPLHVKEKVATKIPNTRSLKGNLLSSLSMWPFQCTAGRLSQGLAQLWLKTAERHQTSELWDWFLKDAQPESGANEQHRQATEWLSPVTLEQK